MKNTIKILLLAALLMATSTALAVPTQLTHQGRLLDSSGAPMTGSVTVDFSIYDASEGGAIVWSQQSQVQLGETGFYTVTLGDGSNPIDSSVLASQSAWMELTVDGTTLSPRMSLNSVPFAVLAGTANEALSVASGAITSDMVDSIDYDKLTNVPAAQEDTLDTVMCASGESVTFDGTDWVCSAVPTTTLPGGASESVVSKISVRALGTCGTETDKPRLGVFVNRELINEIEIPNATYSSFDFAVMPSAYASEIGIAFMNDGDSNGCDRDLSVESITLNDRDTIMTTDTSRVVFDKDVFFDNREVVPGTDMLTETGVLRFFIAPYTSRDNEFVGTNQACPTGEYVEGFDPLGEVVCASYTGGDFALSNQSCPGSQKVTGIDSAGNVTCSTDIDTTYNGANFALSSQSCPSNQFVRGINNSGAVICATDQNTTYNGSTFALSNRACPSSSSMYGVSGSGTPLCQTLSGRGVRTSSCTLSGYVNNFDGVINYTCPSGRVVNGFYSYHNNSTEDRRWRFRCCSLDID